MIPIFFIFEKFQKAPSANDKATKKTGDWQESCVIDSHLSEKSISSLTRIFNPANNK